MNWTLWLRGLIAAIVNGAASSVTVVIVDPIDFNLFEGGAIRLATVAAVAGLFGMASYLKEHPTPVTYGAE